jgi:hypothetical protein
MRNAFKDFSPAERAAFDAQRGGERWWHRYTDRLPFSRKGFLLRHRRASLVDVWANDPDDPEGWRKGGGVQGWTEPLDCITADGTQISNTTTETIVCPDFNVPAYYMASGRALRIWAFGVNSNVVTTPGTLTFRVRWGGVAGTVLLQSAAQSLDTTAHTNALWSFEAHIVCRTVGPTGTFLSGGILNVYNLLASTAANLLPAVLGSAGAPGASGSAAVTVDTTTAKLLSVTAAFSVATSPTNLTCQQRIIEALG